MFLTKFKIYFMQPTWFYCSFLDPERTTVREQHQGGAKRNISEESGKGDN